MQTSSVPVSGAVPENFIPSNRGLPSSSDEPFLYGVERVVVVTTLATPAWL